ncbi:serine/threonine-protein kinase [Sorangium sp. So ce1078]|uniref:serine/threonine-protein kinase n=1 Tax=Sorangium sp. So ce1078 TaxID=3133329 RepID=UPI003F63CF0B
MVDPKQQPPSLGGDEETAVRSPRPPRLPDTEPAAGGAGKPREERRHDTAGAATEESTFRHVRIAVAAETRSPASADDATRFAGHAPPSSRAAPSTQIGPYRLLGKLGQGGMGVVYRGKHAETGQTAAIKTIFSASELTIASIRREIYALGRLRHPGVVRIVDQGVSDGLPWYAMELLEGRTLQTCIQEIWHEVRSAETAPLSAPGTQPAGADPRSPASREAIRHMLTLIRRLCAPLAYLHGQGIVHRDLKPANVFLRDGDLPVLVDLGIAGSFSGAEGREELAVDREVMGTLAYMAPEQMLGKLTDARADLYALGCILYQCLTGCTPFPSSPESELGRHHLRTAPQPPSIRAPHVPPELDALVLRLLAKEPRDRLGYAEDVARALEAAGADPHDPLPLPRPSPYLYRPKLTGRDATLRRLGREIGALIDRRRGGKVLVGGESGAGKTRLIMEVARDAKMRGAAVMTGRCVAIGADDGAVKAAPLHLFRSCLIEAADRCRALGTAETERIFGERGKALEPYEPCLADLPYARERPPLPPLPAQAARARLFRCMREVLFALAEAAPLLLLLDDLQWADELSLDLLAELSVGSLRAAGVLVLGAYRMDELRPELDAIARAPEVLSVELGRLTQASAGAMAREMLALPESPRHFDELLFQHSAGNPFFIAEYLHMAIDAGLLSRDAAGAWQTEALEQAMAMPMPRSLESLITRRLLALHPASAELVQIAAVLGRELDGALLLGTAGIDEEAWMEALRELRVRQIFEEAGEGRLRFVHDKIREIAYKQIPEERLRALHRRAAERLEVTLAEDAADRAPVLAHHFSRAGVHDKAIAHLTEAGDRARSVYANSDAIALYRAAIAEMSRRAEAPGAASAPGADDDAQRAALEERLGDVLAVTGKQDDARRAYVEALSRLDPAARVDRARLHRKRGKTWETHLEHGQALAAYAEAEASLGLDEPTASRSEAWWHEWMQAKIDRLEVYYFMGQLDALKAQVEAIQPMVEQYATPVRQAQFFYGLMLMQIRIERYQASELTVRHVRSFIAATEAAGDPQLIASAHFSGGFVHLWHGALDTAEAYLVASLGAAERMGNVIVQSRALTYRTMIRRLRHQRAEVRAMALRSLEVATAGHMRDYMGAAEANLAWCAWSEGAPEEEIVRRAGAALHFWTELPAPFPFEWTARLVLLAVHLERGRLGAAVEQAAALRDVKQHRFPGALDERLEQAVAVAGGGGPPERSRAALEALVACARDHGYL